MSTLLTINETNDSVQSGVKSPSDESLTMKTQFLEESETGFASMGVEPFAEYLSGPRPELNGLRVKMPNRQEIYLIDSGYRRWIPNQATYDNLFRDRSGIISDINVDAIPLGANITSGAMLARASGTAPVYLIDQNVKRWIVSPAIFDQYWFASKQICTVSPVIINAIPSGPNIAS